MDKIELKKLFKNILKGRTRTSLALQQISISFVLKGVGVLVSFMFVPLLINYLDKERYGLWLTLVSVLNWANLFDLGLGNGLRYKLGEALAKNEYALGRTYVSTTYFLISVIFLPLIVVFLVVGQFLDWQMLLNTSLISNEELYLITSVVFSLFCLRFILKLIGVISKAEQKPTIDNAISVTGQLAAFITIFIITKMYSDASLLLVGSIIAGSPVLMYFIYSIVIFNGSNKHLAPSVAYIKLEYKDELLNLGVKYFIVGITSVAIFSTYNILILHLYGAEEVTIFNIAFKLFSAPTMVFMIILSPAWSAVTDAYHQQDFKWLKMTLKRYNILSLLFVIVVVGIALFAQELIDLWIGENIVVPYSIILGLAVFGAMRIVISPYSNFINGFGKMKLTTRFSIVGIVTFFALSFILSTYIENSLSIAIALSCTSLIGLITNTLQTHKILNGTAKGIWLE